MLNTVSYCKKIFFKDCCYVIALMVISLVMIHWFLVLSDQIEDEAGSGELSIGDLERLGEQLNADVVSSAYLIAIIMHLFEVFISRKEKNQKVDKNCQIQ